MNEMFIILNSVQMVKPKHKVEVSIELLQSIFENTIREEKSMRFIIPEGNPTAVLDTFNGNCFHLMNKDEAQDLRETLLELIDKLRAADQACMAHSDIKSHTEPKPNPQTKYYCKDYCSKANDICPIYHKGQTVHAAAAKGRCVQFAPIDLNKHVPVILE
ncbi:hypothetical protein KA005_22030 [bacterium]|nr:hypothetical protein [bacterium]